MANASLLSHAAILKQLWGKDLEDTIYRFCPALGIFGKDEQFTQDIYHQAVTFGANQGYSGDYTTTRNRRSAAKTADFQVKAKTAFSSLALDGILLRRAKYGKDRAMIVDPLMRESELTMNQFKRNLSIYMHGNGGGAIGKIASIAGSTINLTSYSDVKNFQIGQFLQASATDGTTGAVVAGFGEIASIVNDPITPQIVLVAAVPGTWAATQFLFLDGTFGLCMEGFDAWNPLWTTATLPGTKFGVNRNLHPTLLAGVSEDCTSLSVHDTITKLAGKIDYAGQTANTALISSANYEVLANELRDKTVIQVSAMAGGGYHTNVQYDAIKISAGRGVVEVVSDPSMPDNVVRVFDKSKGKIVSVGPLVHWDQDNGPDNIRTENAEDAREIRLVSDANFLVTVPSAFARGTVLPPV